MCWSSTFSFTFIFLIKLMCCGGGKQGPDDWENNVYFNCSSKIMVNGLEYTPTEACGVPYSCCIVEEFGLTVINSQCGFGVRRLDVSVLFSISS